VCLTTSRSQSWFDVLNDSDVWQQVAVYPWTLQVLSHVLGEGFLLSTMGATDQTTCKLPNMKSRTPIKTSSSSSRVYSTGVGRTCPGCLRAQEQCVCKTVHNTLQAADAGDGIVRLHRERKGRKGKGVTVIRGLGLVESELAKLAKSLKSRCGVGGSVSAGVIELQTADREKIKSLLEVQGYTVKIAGG